MVLWVAVPAFVLTGVALDVRLSWNWPDPPQRWAGAAVLWALALLSGLLHRRLLRTPASLATAVALAVPLVVAATSLAEVALSATVVPLLWLTAWLVALHALARRPASVLGASLATLPAALAVLAYLRAEVDPVAAGVGPSIFLPPLPLTVAASTSLPLARFYLPAALVLAAGADLLVVRVRRRRR